MPRKPKTFRKKKTGLTKAARKEVNTIVDTRQKEYNYKDTKTSAATNITDYTVTLVYSFLGGISTGVADVAQRLGDKIYLKSLHLNYNILGPADNYNVIRMVIFRVKDESSFTGPNFQTEVMNSPANVSESMVSPYKHDHRSKWVILMDKVFTMNSGQGLACFQKYIKFKGKGLCIQYDASGTTPIKNDIKMAVWSDSTAVSHPQIQFNCRAHYLS